MQPDHYAIVIGLSSYPTLGDPPPADLKGPERDADAVVAWLTDPKGGGLPPENVKLIRSSDFHSPPEPAPIGDQIAKATFIWLDSIAKKNQQAGNGRRVGARLYLYAAGHGFSPRANQACLLAGDAAEEQYSANVFPSGWIEWFQDAEYFREFVLWMDCCMDRVSLTQPTPPPVAAIGGGTAPARTFIGFAAPRPLKAVERPIPEDGNQWHGVFTWNLLLGLRGAAANRFGVVTAQSLADWLRQAQLGWLDEGDRSNPDVAKEPSIVVQGNDMVFARGVAPRPVEVVLRFPTSMTGKSARIWSRAGAGAPFTVVEGGTSMPLKPGLYVAEVAEGGLRHGFVVTRAETLVLAESGDAGVEESGPFQMAIETGDETADIRVIGDNFEAIDSGGGNLTLSLPFGLYLIRLRTGRQIVEKVVLLDANWPRPAAPADALPPLPEITSAAPLPNTRATHEYQRAAAEFDGAMDVTEGNGAELMVMVRCFSGGQGASPGSAEPWKGVSVLTPDGRVLADLATVGQRRSGGDPVTVCRFALAPGPYVLRYEAGERGIVEQSLVLPPGGWRLEAYLLKTVKDGRMEHVPRFTMLMRRIGSPWGTAEDLRLEKARVALADERPLISKELNDLLRQKLENPLCGIIGGHLLLIAHEQGTSRSLDTLEAVVKCLRDLVGTDHPDVEALSFGCLDQSLWSQRPLAAPPLLERSWRMIIKASQGNAQLVPLAIWQKAHAALAMPPFLSWCADPSRQRKFRKALASAAFGLRAAPSPSPGGDGEVPSFSPAPPAVNAAALGLPPLAMAALEEEYRTNA
jgi:hypothetical protein